MTESTQVESTLCSLLPCTLHIFTRTRLCQTNYGIIFSTLLHSFCSSPSDHRELRTKLCPSLDKAFLFTNQGFPHTVILPQILKDWRESCSYHPRLQNLAEMPCTGARKSEKQESGLVHWHHRSNAHTTYLPDTPNCRTDARILCCLWTQGTKLTYICGHGSAPQCLMESWYIRASPQPAKLAKTVECYKRSTPHNWAHSGHHSNEGGRPDRSACWQVKLALALAAQEPLTYIQESLSTFTDTLAQNYPASSTACRIRAVATHTHYWKTIPRKGLSPHKHKGLIVFTVSANLKAR